MTSHLKTMFATLVTLNKTLFSYQVSLFFIYLDQSASNKYYCSNFLNIYIFFLREGEGEYKWG